MEIDLVVSDETSLSRTGVVIRKSKNCKTIVKFQDAKTKYRSLVFFVFGLLEVCFAGDRSKSKLAYLCLCNVKLMAITGIILRLARFRVVSYFPELAASDKTINKMAMRILDKVSYKTSFPSKPRARLFYNAIRTPFNNDKISIEKNIGHEISDKKKVAVFIENSIRCVYAGVIYKERPLDKILMEMISVDQIVEVALHGEGDDAYIRALTRLSPKVKYYGRYDCEDEVTLLLPYDIGIVSYPNNTLNNHFCEPNKINVYNQLGMPMIADSPPDLVVELLISNSKIETSKATDLCANVMKEFVCD